MPMYPYQEEALATASEGAVLLALPPGAGKSLVALRRAQQVIREHQKSQERPSAPGLVLVIGPAIAESVWQDELAKWWPEASFAALRGLRSRPRPAGDAPLLVFTSYDLLVASEKARGAAIALGAIDMAIVDEAHALKNPEAKRTRLLYGPRLEGNGLLVRARHRLLLSGTPMPNGAHEIFTHLRALAPERIAEQSYAAWVARTCIVRQMLIGGRQVPQIVGTRPDAVPYVRQVLQGFAHRPPADQLAEGLPPIRSRIVRLPARLLDAGMIAEAERSPEADLLRGAIAAGRSLGSVEGHVARVRRLLALSKIAGAAAWAEQALDEGEPKVLIWAWHLEAIEELARRLARHHPAVITGGSTPPQRAAAVEAFQANPACRVSLGQIAAAGQAITLIAGRRAIFLEQAWTPALNHQAAKRCHRVGQHSPVLIDVLVATGSLDEAVARTLARKDDDLRALAAA